MTSTTANRFNLLRLAFATSMVAALAACGGGGGGSSTVQPPAPSPAPSPSGDISSVIQPATYAASGREELTYQALNHIRQAGGFGTLTQSTALDAAAKNQADYASANYVVQGTNGSGLFYEAETQPGMYYLQTQGVGAFVGEAAIDRAVAFGYPRDVTLQETVDLFTSNLDPTTDAGYCVNNTLASPSARSFLLDLRYRNMGVGYSTLTQPISPGSAFYMSDCYLTVAAPGVEYSAAHLATAPAGWVGVYPPDGSTATFRFNSDNTSHGFAPSVTVDSQLTLTTTSFTITDASGAVVPTTLNLDAVSPPLPNWAFATPNAPLAPNATFTATFVGTAGGSAISRTWTFVTPAQ